MTKRNMLYMNVLWVYIVIRIVNHCHYLLIKKILKDYVQDWKRRNPNLEMIGAYYHNDEQGKQPHVHIDYVPVAHGYKEE